MAAINAGVDAVWPSFEDLDVTGLCTWQCSWTITMTTARS